MYDGLNKQKAEGRMRWVRQRESSTERELWRQGGGQDDVGWLRAKAKAGWRKGVSSRDWIERDAMRKAGQARATSTCRISATPILCAPSEPVSGDAKERRK